MDTWTYVACTALLMTLARALVPWEDGSKRKELRLDGDIILGGLFPMHEKGQGGRLCGDLKEDKGIQRLEAMLYAIKNINRDPKLLPNIKLGVHILDTCLRDTYALEQSLDFVKAHMNTLDVADFRCEDGRRPIHTPSKPVAGVIGAAASPVSIMVANILRLFKIPQISYASTGIELSDKSRFEYFSRVVPPDTLQARAMVDVVRHLGWSYVSTLADEGNYGEKGIGAFEDLAKSSGLCIAASLRIPRELKNDTFHTILQELRKQTYERAKAVVMFVNEDNIRRLLAASIQNNLTDHFYWLASDSWGAKTYPIEGQEFSAEGAVTVLPNRTSIKDFDRYFLTLDPFTHRDENPWFDEFWEKHFQCSFHGNISSTTRGRCTGYERLSRQGHVQEGLVPFVVDAVYAMAHALQNFHKQKCQPEQKVCDAMTPIAGPELLQHIRNVSFIGTGGNAIMFDKNGDPYGRYTIYQFQKGRHNKYSYVPIGSWTESLFLNMSVTRWKNRSRKPPISVCSEPCKPGHARHSKGLHACCWACIKCTDYEILKDEYTCWECPNGSYPNHRKDECLPLPVSHLALDGPWALIPVVFSSIGLIVTSFVLVVFIKFNKTPVIMASGRELCYVLLFGLAFCYIMTFIMVAKPSVISCAFLRLGLGLSLSICYSALFTKTNRISRIFNRGIKAMVKRPSYTSPKSQLVICSCLVSVQVMGAITWISMDLPGTRYEYPDRFTVVLRCKSTNFAIVMSLLYNMILITLCTVYAFKTRKIPENYNEAKYIAFTMYSTCIVWLAFIPIYFGTKNDFKIQITALSMCLSISATVALGCLFAPKVYIVLFQPHKNVRHNVAAALNPQGQRGAGRPFLSRRSNTSGLVGAMNGNFASPTGLAMLIAQGTVKAAEEAKKAAQEAAELDSIKDLDSSGQEISEPETNL